MGDERYRHPPNGMTKLVKGKEMSMDVCIESAQFYSDSFTVWKFYLNSVVCTLIRVKVFENRPSKICVRQLLKNLKRYGLLWLLNSTNFTWSTLEYLDPSAPHRTMWTSMFDFFWQRNSAALVRFSRFQQQQIAKFMHDFDKNVGQNLSLHALPLF